MEAARVPTTWPGISKHMLEITDASLLKLQASRPKSTQHDVMLMDWRTYSKLTIATGC